jgi:hypothetical protein
MNALNHAIKESFDTSGSTKAANKAYLEFIKANFIVPVELHAKSSEPEVLFLADNHQLFLPVFTEMAFLSEWAKDINQSIQLLQLSGVDLLKGIGDDVFVCLDIGTECYKEFNPSEIARMRSMILKIFKN